jgi:hypothetical protein
MEEGRYREIEGKWWEVIESINGETLYRKAGLYGYFTLEKAIEYERADGRTQYPTEIMPDTKRS